MSVHEHVSYTYDHEEGDEVVELEVNYGNIDEVSVQRIGDRYLVGYLVQDQDGSSSDPEDGDGDGNGFIGTSSSRDDRERQEIYQEALGLDSDWRPIVTVVSLIEELADELDRTPESLLRPLPPAKFVLGELANAELLKRPQYWYERKLTRNDLKKPYRGRYDQLLGDHRTNGDLGDIDAVLLDVYEHSGRMYAVSGRGGYPFDDPWDSARGGAVWVPDDHLRNMEAKGLVGEARRAKMIEWAGQHVETMNSWMNGDVWGVVTHWNDLEGAIDGDSDECWGYIGGKWALEELTSNLKWKAEHAEQPVAA